MKATAWGLAGDEGSFLWYSFCCRFWRLLHGALYLPSGDTAQLAVPQTGGRLPQQGVWEQQRSSRQNHEGWKSASTLPLMCGSIWMWSKNTCCVSLQCCPACLTLRANRLSTVLSVLCPLPTLRHPCARQVRKCGVSVELYFISVYEHNSQN